jgi:hypothetical protein
MAFSLGQSLLKLPEDSASGATFPLKKPQQVPKPDDFSLSHGVHIGSLRTTRPNVNEQRTNRKPLGLGATVVKTTRRLAEGKVPQRPKRHHLIPAPEQHESAYLLPENAVDGGVVFGI